MLLRSITKHVKDQNWFAVFLDFFIVVAGILIAFQITNWNEARKNRLDEAQFLTALHDEITIIANTSSDLVDYRIEILEALEDALDVLFQRGERSELSESECESVLATRSMNVIINEIGYFDDLSASGRVNIIQNNELRLALVRLQQTIKSSNNLMLHLSNTVQTLEVEYPDLIRVEGQFYVLPNGRSEAFSTNTCNTRKMQNDMQFLNAVSVNVDMYDAFIRDVMEPWRGSISEVHKILDSELGMTHEAKVAE